jgi:hypothetical protein
MYSVTFMGDLEDGVLDCMIGFIDTFFTATRNHSKLQRYR